MPRTDNMKFYNASLKKYENNAQKVQWSCSKRQEIRFEVIKNLLKDELENSSIIDAGCGLADLYVYLHKEGVLPLKYIGIDSHKKMVKLARKSSQQEILCLDILRDKLPVSDYYLCSGALNILEKFETLLFIKKILAVSTKGVVFNILKGDSDDSIYNKYQVAQMKDMLSFFEGKIEIVEDYLDDDFTVFLKRFN